MSSENPKLTAYLNLVTASEKQEFCQTPEGEVIPKLVAALVWAKIQAEETGLTEAEMQAAIVIGEYRNPHKRNPPVDSTDYAPGNTEGYWRAVYSETYRNPYEQEEE